MDGTLYSPEKTVGEQKKRGICGSTLKLVAIFTMLIDHTAATILDNLLKQRGMDSLDYSNTEAVANFFVENRLLYGIDISMRLIGRIAFPIFCFLLVEGMIHTHNKRKYAMRLAIFALISEIPFDMAFYGKTLYWGHQNVFFTLLIGLLVMLGFETIREEQKDKKWLPILSIIGAIMSGCIAAYCVNAVIKFINSVLINLNSEASIELSKMVIIGLVIIWSIISLIVYGMMRKKDKVLASIRFADLAVLITGMVLAQAFSTDYSAFGILTIAIMYRLRKNHFKTMLGGCITLNVMTLSEFPCFINLILIRFYNGTRGLNLKYVFYLFYPVHLFILYLICYFMKII